MSPQWKTIDSAPKNNTALLLCCADWPLSVVHGKDVPIKISGWRTDKQEWNIFGASWEPTHYMLLDEIQLEANILAGIVNV